MLVIHRMDGEPPGRDVLVVGACGVDADDWRPGDRIRVRERLEPRFYPGPELPPSLALMAEPIASFGCVAIGFPSRRWPSRLLEEARTDAALALRMSAFFGPPVEYETAVQVLPDGPHPRLLPGWVPSRAWFALTVSLEWQDARLRAGLPPLDRRSVP